MATVREYMTYELIRKMESGLYVWADPTPASVVRITQLMRKAPFELEDATSWHVTLLYCDMPEMPDGCSIPDNQWLESTIFRCAVWIDHKQRPIVVLELNAPELQAFHKNLCAQGLEHSYPEYTPHVTLRYDASDVDDAELKAFVDQVNQHLRVVRHPLIFGPQIKATAID